jgi:class 3 adenylate cyclase/tetratricopeptide (TPR) repeat protein
VPICTRCGQESPDGFRFCGACGAPLDQDASRREARKTVTVLFCDIAGSTALGERLDPESLRRVMARYFDEMSAVLERHGATVEKFIGDAVMAVFGIPVVHEDDALRACRAACEMRERLRDLNAELEHDHAVRIEQRTGVNTGAVVTGDTFDGQRLATGDAVNVAARLEQAAPAGEILIGETTRALCRDALEVVAVGPVEAKGKSSALAAWRLVRVIEGAPGIARHLESPLVGRVRELDLLRHGFERALDDRSCHLYTVLGAAGVGKSRLVLELERELDVRALVLHGKCLPYGDGITYWPLWEVFRQAGAEHELDEALQATSSGEIAWAVRSAIERWAAVQPVVLVLDDVHWAEQTFLDLVEHIADLSRESALLVVCMARPELLEVRPGWAGGKPNATTVMLQPLSREESGALILNLVPGASLDGGTEARIIDAAEGNPLFVEELVAMAKEDALADGAVEVPATIQALLAARLDRLAPLERAVVDRGSIEGRVFHRGAVVELSPPGDRDISDALVALVRKELIRPESPDLPGEEAFRFRHLLVRDVAYDAVPKSVRADLHERLADWLERAVGNGRAERHEAILGYHLEQACRYVSEVGPANGRSRELARRAVERLESAGQHALAHGDASAATKLLRRAEALLTADGDRRRQLLPTLGRASAMAGHLAEAVATFDEVIALAREAGDVVAEDDAVVERLDVLLLNDPEGRVEEARSEVAERLPRVEERGDDRALARCYAILLQCAHIELDPDEMTHIAGNVIVHATHAGASQLADDASGWLLFALFEGSQPVSEALALLDSLPEPATPFGKAWRLVQTGLIYTASGRIDEARAVVEQGRRMLLELGQMVFWGATSMSAAWIELAGRDPDAAERILLPGLDALERAGERSYYSTGMATLADVLLLQGRLEEAAEATVAAERAAASNDLATQYMWRGIRARVLARRGDHEEAERLVREAVRIVEASPVGLPGCPFLGDVHTFLADVLRTAGQEEAAREAAEQALVTYELKGYVPKVAEMRAFLGEAAPEVP